jgi:MFS family permease
MPSAQLFTDFMIIAIFNGFGNAQASGTITTWLDNNYQKVVGDADPDRKVYGFSRSRILTMSRVAGAASFIVGGYLATIISRQFVFEIQTFLLIILIVLTFKLVTDEKSDSISKFDQNTNTRKSPNSFFKHLAGGIKFLFGNKASFFFLIGSAFVFASIAIWGQLILFPIYFGYTGSDSLASVLRTTAFFVGIPISLYTAKISKKFTKDKLPLVLFGFVLLFFPSFILLTSIIPVTNELNIIGAIFTIILLNAILPTLADLEGILRQRFMLDLVPSDHRNAVYSLIPTIISILGIFLLPIAGTLIEGFGLAAGISLAFLVGIIAAVMVTLGMYFHKKSTEEKTEATVVQLAVQTTTGP